MKTLALTALAWLGLPLAALPASAGTDPAPTIVPDPAAGARLAALLSVDLRDVSTLAPRPSRASAANVRVIQPVKIAIRPGDVERAAAARAAKAAPAKDARRPAAKASRTRSARTPAATGGSGASTIASWYNDRPSACWDRGGRHAFPKGLSVWTAHKTLPCGTAIVVSGPAGSVTARVWDRGPYVAGRALDLSAAAFRATCGPTSRGVCRVTWRRA